MLYTVKEIAEKTGISKSTARRYLIEINAIPEESVHKSVSGADAKLKEYRYSDTVLEDITALIKEKQEKKKAIHKNSEPVQESVQESVYESLLKQIEAKDKQIENLQKALDQEQQLHAMAENRLKMIEDKTKQEAPAPDSEERRSLWSRIKQVFTG